MPKAKEGGKGAAGKKGAKKASKKGAAKKAATAATAADFEAPCLTVTQSAFIVGACLPSGSHANDDTLEETGLISPNLRQIFRECVFNGVDQAGCKIDRGQIPNGADTEVGEVIQAVFQNSR